VYAGSALFALGFWPAVVLAARPAAPVAARAAASAAACGLLATTALAQSKGTAFGLGVSAVAVFALVPRRLRMLLPTLLAAGVVALAFRSLTAPYRATTSGGLEHAIRQGGWIVLACAAAGLALGAALALADRRVTVGAQTRRRIGAFVALLLVALSAAGCALFFAHVHHPGRFVEDKWRSFKQLKVDDRTSTHLLSLGSNRYDFWRVAVARFEAHPVAGVGARGFYSAYLERRRSNESPLRAHSLYLDALSEEGIVGFGLLAGGLGVVVAALVRRLDRAPAAAAFAAAIYFLAHAGVDWIWTFPALGIPFFLLLGIAGGGGAGRPLARPVSLAAAAASVLLALLAFAPPWISARFTARAYADPAGSADDLRWARRLDPLTLDPLFARWRLAATPAARIPPLEEARRLQPKSVAVLTQLALAYLDVGRRADARRTFAEAERLDPHDPALAALVGRAGR
jgi:O-antigen ligase